MGSVINSVTRFAGLGDLNDSGRSESSSQIAPVSEFDRLLKQNDLQLSDLNLDQLRQRVSLQNSLLFGQPIDTSLFPNFDEGSLASIQQALGSENQLGPLRQQLAAQQLQQALGLGTQQGQLSGAQLQAGLSGLGQQQQVLGQLGQQVGQNAPLQDAIRQSQLNTLANGGAPTDQQTQLLNQQFGSLLNAGNANIDFQTQNALDQVRNVFAPSRGLLTTDTPVLDRAGAVAQAGLLQKGNLAQQIIGQRAQAGLQLPLQSAQTFGNINQQLAQQNLGAASGLQAPISSSLQQQGLNQQALQFGSQFSPGVTSLQPTFATGQAFGFLQPIDFQGAQFGNTNQSIGTAPSLANNFGSSFLSSFGQGLGGSTAAGISDGRLKEDIHPIDHADVLLQAIDGVRFRWRDSGATDIGVIAQNVERTLPDAIIEIDGVKHVKPLALIGVLIDVVKSLTTRVADLEAAEDLLHAGA